MWRWVVLKLWPYLQLDTKARNDMISAPSVEALQANISNLQATVSELQSNVSSLRDEVFRLRDELAAVVGFFGLVVMRHITGETEVLFASGGVKEEYKKAADAALQKRDEAILAHAVKALVVTIEAIGRRKISSRSG